MLSSARSFLRLSSKNQRLKLSKLPTAQVGVGADICQLNLLNVFSIKFRNSPL